MNDEKLSDKEVGKAALGLIALIIVGTRLAGCWKSDSDNVAANAPAAQASQAPSEKIAEQPKPKMDWSRELEEDPMSDKKTLKFSTKNFPEMVVFCKEGEKNLRIYVRYKGMFEINPEIKSIQAALGGNPIPYWDLKVRFDQGRPINQKWNINTEYEYFAPMNEIYFMKSMAKHQKLVLLPRGKASADVFNISGADIVFRELKSFCKF